MSQVRHWSSGMMNVTKYHQGNRLAIDHQKCYADFVTKVPFVGPAN